MRAIAENGCMVVWCGEGEERFYGYGMGEARASERLIRQAKCLADPKCICRYLKGNCKDPIAAENRPAESDVLQGETEKI